MKKKERVAAIAAAALMMMPAISGVARKSSDSAMTRNLNTFSTIMRELQMNYVDTLQIDSVFDTAISAMLMTIDPYTEFYTPEEREKFSNMTSGEYGGIGSSIMERNGAVYISEPFENSPAVVAGLRPGDKIIRIDTTDMTKATVDRVSSHLRGKPESKAIVRVVRPYTKGDSVLDIEVTRKKIQTASVPYYTMLDGNIGYINLSSFMERSSDEVRSALDSLSRQGEMKGLVFDIRGNGGGLLESAVGIVGNFVPKGTEVLRTRGRNKKEERIYKTTREPKYADLPMVVLIDGGSASASEITAGSLQDLDRAVLVGSRSFGKGLVQSTRPLPYDNMLKITVSKYYIPSGRLIQAFDYSHRNPDGSVARTPDSLTNVFHTATGREVRDGGGLKPDVEVDWGTVNRLVYNLVRDNWIFDYATKYAAEHPSIGDPAKFEITDELYEDFKKSIDPDKFKYDKVCEDMMKNLREVAEAEGYMNDSTKAQFDALGKMLTHNLQSDLDLKRKEIERYLLEEILGRYYFDRGRTMGMLRDDKGLKKALEILNDPAEYKRILSAPLASKGTAKKGKKK